MSAPLPAGKGVAEGPRGAHSPQIFRTYRLLCFERRYHKQNSVIRLKSKILDPTKFPPEIFGLATLLPAGASCQTCERIVLLLVVIG